MGPEHTACEQRSPPSLSTRVCLALAEQDDAHPWESSPLYDELDPAVLETLDEQDNRQWRLEVEVEDHTVVATGDGEVTVDGEDFSERDLRETLDSLHD